MSAPAEARWKYFVYREGGRERLVLFPTSVMHAARARALNLAPDAIMAAGFVALDGTCFGWSTSLGVGSRGRADQALLLAG